MVDAEWSDESYRFEDPDLAEGFLSDALGPARLGRGPDERFVLDIRVMGTTELRLHETSSGPYCTVSAKPSPRFVAPAVASGELTIDDGRGPQRLAAGDVALLLPGRRLRLRGADCHAWAVDLPMDRLRASVAEQTAADTGQLRFDAATPVDPGMGRLWFHTVRYSVRMAALPDSPLREPLLRGELVHTLAAAALQVFPSSGIRGPAPSTVRFEPAALRRAVQYIDDHAAQAITIADIAAAAGTGARAVQYAFRRHRDTTPLLYLRKVRLEQARRELLEADPEGPVTVSEVGHRWGFVSPGAFSTAYRQQFGTTPVRALRA